MEYHDLTAEIERILGAKIENGIITLPLQAKNSNEAKNLVQKLTLMQKQLKLLRQKVYSDMISMENSFISARSNVGPGILTGLLNGILGRGAGARYRALKRHDISKTKQNNKDIYRARMRMIDSAVLVLEEKKLQFKEYILKESKSL